MVYANNETDETVSKRECNASGDTVRVGLPSFARRKNSRIKAEKT